MESLPVEIIVELRKNGLTFKEISSKLQQNYPQQRGFSERSFVATVRNTISKKWMNEEAVKEVYIIMLLDKDYTAVI